MAHGSNVSRGCKPDGMLVWRFACRGTLLLLPRTKHVRLTRAARLSVWQRAKREELRGEEIKVSSASPIISLDAMHVFTSSSVNRSYRPASAAPW